MGLFLLSQAVIDWPCSFGRAYGWRDAAVNADWYREAIVRDQDG